MNGFKVAVVGATGNVGREMLRLLAERKFPASEVVALASKSSIGREVSYGDTKILKVKALDDYDFHGTDIALFSPGGAVSAKFAPKAAAAGCVVIDNTSHFRMDKEIPLVVPEVNPDAISEYTKSFIIANPNCSTIQMVCVLKPLHDFARIKRVVVSTYQSVSGAGKGAMDELYDQTKAMYMNESPAPSNFTKNMPFNVIPHIDVFMDNGMTKEEWKMVEETKKIMGANIPVSVTCVRVPVFVGHAEAINIEFEDPINEEQVREILAAAPGVEVFDERKDGGYMTPIECVGEEAVYVSRIRQDHTLANGINLWCVSDNLRKGAALNAIQIAEFLVENYNLIPSGQNLAVN
ncbi:MAG: aspartate-semialdehyde dehydrogenase [Alphaproteobacteria bacterium CG11_big_fil_rev_8_21_14_0_20_44_7]|nr:MAG: aspartate-semialdehyde dehydrogenase [Alphaproteobacteria bacterium CG11_big_fil_rev_8_21_14_0_20_44_7]